jgi:hypothetical protein
MHYVRSPPREQVDRVDERYANKNKGENVPRSQRESVRLSPSSEILKPLFSFAESRGVPEERDESGYGESRCEVKEV